MRSSISLLLLATSLFSASARAEILKSEPAGFLIQHRIIVPTDAPTSFDALRHIERWWGAEHTYSGESRYLSLDARAGGCWCERWPGGEVEHARVLLVLPDRQLRLEGGLGPLQEMAVTGVLDFSLLQGKDGTQIDLSYRVSGHSGSGLDGVATIVDGVLGEQLGLLKDWLVQRSAELKSAEK